MTNIDDLLAVPIEGPLSQGDSQTVIKYRQALMEMQEEIERLQRDLKIERGGIDWKTLAIDEERERMNWKRIAEERHETLEATRKELGEVRHELAGAHGEIMGLRVTAGFFEQRCSVLERAIAGHKLEKREQASLAGCCPFCGVTVGEYVTEATKNILSQSSAHVAEIERLKADVEQLRRDRAAYVASAIATQREGA